MAETAFQIQYRQEFIAGFEQLQSIVRMTTTTEAVIKGNQATFLIADSGPNETAKTRGVNGLIPARGDNLTQPVATLVEWHDLVRKTGFNVFASQGNQRAIMQQTSMGVVNRKIDNDIITELDTATLTTGVAAAPSLLMCLTAKSGLGNNDVPFDGNICALITPGFEGELMESVPQFASADYINLKPYPDAGPAWDDSPGYWKWLGVKWIVHPNLSGATTVSATNHMYHKSAIGHAYNSDDLQALAGYDEEQDYSWARTSIFMGSQILQNSGIAKMLTIDNVMVLS